MDEKSLNEVNRIRENLNSELKAVAQQAVSTIKGELAAVISSRITAQGISDALNEKEFLQKIIFTVLQKWNPADTNFQFELLLNKDDEAKLHDFFEQRIKKELGTEVEIVIENKIKSGFKIGVKNENYYVSFSDEDFENFFKGYLRKKTLEWIYKTKENEHK
jgi:V/A-type H+-transporting ATPase subunit E